MHGLPQQSARDLTRLPRFLEDLINNPPTAGTGVHDWMFEVARNLHCRNTDPEIESLLKQKLANCGRHVSEREIKAAVANSSRFAYHFKEDRSNVSEYKPDTPPQADLRKIEATALYGKGLADLMEASPYTHHESDAEYFIDRLFPDNALLCCGGSPYEFNTKARSLWRGQLNQQSFIVPSPMNAHTGLTQDGKMSAHSLNNTGPRRFLVIEFDFSLLARDGKTPTKYHPMLLRLQAKKISVSDLCAALLLWLNQIWPMSLAVSSGGKSIHGWWFCHGRSDDSLKPFWNLALKLGADPKTWLRSQFIRIPDGVRDNGKRQSVLYFNPA